MPSCHTGGEIDQSVQSILTAVGSPFSRRDPHYTRENGDGGSPFLGGPQNFMTPVHAWYTETPYEFRTVLARSQTKRAIFKAKSAIGLKLAGGLALG